MIGMRQTSTINDDVLQTRKDQPVQHSVGDNLNSHFFARAFLSLLVVSCSLLVLGCGGYAIGKPVT